VHACMVCACASRHARVCVCVHMHTCMFFNGIMCAYNPIEYVCVFHCALYEYICMNMLSLDHLVYVCFMC